MKTLLRLPLIAVGIAFGIAGSLDLGLAHGTGLPVVDTAAILQAIEQYKVATNMLEQARVQLERLGDPSTIKTPAAAALIRSLSASGVGHTLAELQGAASGTAGTAFTAQGLFRAPESTFQTADGKTLPRATTEYRKFDAIARAVQNHEQVMDDTQQRRQQLRQQIQKTLRDIQAATTVAEVQKLHPLLSGQYSELSSLESEREAALSRVLVQQAFNQTDAARQQQARREETEAGVRQATDKLGQLLKVDTTPVQIPSPFTH